MSQINAKLFSTLLALVFISACSSQPSSNNNNSAPVLATSLTSVPTEASVLNDVSAPRKIIRINHYKAECEGFWVDQCLLYRNEGDTDWNYLYEEIEGFDFEWGYSYELLVEVEQTTAIEGLADQSNTVYRLSQILNETHHANEYFDYSSRHPSIILTAHDDGTYALLDGQRISCGVDDCLSIESAITQQQGITLSLKHDANPAQPLVLEAVLCSSSLVSFASDCG